MKNKIVDSLASFVNKLKNREPLKITTIERHQTPDGPMHIRHSFCSQCGEDYEVVFDERFCAVNRCKCNKDFVVEEPQ